MKQPPNKVPIGIFILSALLLTTGCSIHTSYSDYDNNHAIATANSYNV